MEKGYRFMAYPIYVDVNFQGHKIMYSTTSWTLTSGGPCFVSGNGSANLANKHELVETYKVYATMGFPWWTASPPPYLTKFPCA